MRGRDRGKGGGRECTVEMPRACAPGWLKNAHCPRYLDSLSPSGEAVGHIYICT